MLEGEHLARAQREYKSMCDGCRKPTTVEDFCIGCGHTVCDGYTIAGDHQRWDGAHEVIRNG